MGTPRDGPREPHKLLAEGTRLGRPRTGRGPGCQKEEKEKLACVAPTLIRAFIRRLFHLFPPGRSNGVHLTRLVLTTWTRSFPGRSRSKKLTADRLHHTPERLVLRKGQRPHSNVDVVDSFIYRVGTIGCDRPCSLIYLRQSDANRRRTDAGAK